MSLPSRLLRLCASLILVAASGVTLAQTNPQFIQPAVSVTGGRVTQIVPGSFQPSALPDLLYLNAAAGNGLTLSVTSGLLLNRQGFTNLEENQITFSSVLAVTAAAADLNNDGHTDFAYALSPTALSAPDLCVFYGTGSAISAGPQFSPVGQRSGCLTLANPGGQLPSFTSILAVPFNKGGVPQLIIVDSANNVIDVVSNTQSPDNSGILKGFTLVSQLAIPTADGSGPILTGDFNGDGHTDLLINNQTSHSLHVYYGVGDGTFQPPVVVQTGGNVYSVLLHDMDGDGVPDLVAETDGGTIRIFHGYGNSPPAGPFAPLALGGTSAAPTPALGNGGQLVAIGDLDRDGIPDILTATAAGLSVLLGEPGLTFRLAGIYNIGPGRSSFVLADFDGDGNLDLAADSPEGIAITLGIGDGTFRTSRAYATGSPALGAVAGRFRNAASNPSGNVDIAAVTGFNQAQLLTGDGASHFAAAPYPVNPQSPTCSSADCQHLWSNLLTGDLDGDGNADLLFSATGRPLPTGTNAGSGLLVAYGAGDGTFPSLVEIDPGALGAPADDGFYGESTVADLNGDGIADIANRDQSYVNTLLGRSGRPPALGLDLLDPGAGNVNSFAQVASGYLMAGRTSGPQDLIVQNGSVLTPYLNSGDGVHFTAMPALRNPPTSAQLLNQTVLLADIDGDGIADVVVPYHQQGSNPADPSAALANLLYVWYGAGDGTFAQPVVTTLSRNFYLAQVADMNSDGRPDLVLSDGFVVGILYNQGNRSFQTVVNGQTVPAEIDYLAGQGINSITLADVNNDGSLDLVLANGGLAISSPIALGGVTAQSLTLTPNPVVNTGGVTVLLNNILTRPVTGKLVVNPNPSSYTGSVTLTAQFTPSAGVPVPTGTVQFAVNGVAIGSAVAVTRSNTAAAASYTIPAGNQYDGSTTFSASYSGDASNSPVTFYASDAIGGSPTTTTLFLCVGPTPACPANGVPTPPALPYPTSLQMYFGQTFNGTAAAYSTDGSALSPSSTIGFYDAYNGGPPLLLCTLGITAGSSCPPQVGTTVGTGGGTHVFTAVYSGDANHTPSTSPAVTITVVPDTTSATLISSLNPAPQGSAVTFTATLSGNIVGPTGSVTFLDGGTPIGSGTLTPASNGTSSTAGFTTSTLALGTHAITAVYTATLDFNGATSAALNQVILPVLASTSRLTSAPNPSYFGQPVTLTDTVTLQNGASTPVPTGLVTFSDGASPIGTGTLTGGVATFVTSTLAPGTHTLTATASGDSATGGSSASVVQVVNALPAPGSVNFSIVVAPSPVSLGVGGSTSVTVTVKSLTGYAENVTLSCSSLPYEAGCTFGSLTLPVGGSTTLLLSAMAPHTCGTTAPYFVAGSGRFPGGIPLLPTVPALAGLAALALPGRRRGWRSGRRWLRSLLTVAAVAAMVQVTGCGTCTDLGTRPAAYTLQVAGSGSANGEVESTPVTLNVHL